MAFCHTLKQLPIIPHPFANPVSCIPRSPAIVHGRPCLRSLAAHDGVLVPWCWCCRTGCVRVRGRVRSRARTTGPRPPASSAIVHRTPCLHSLAAYDGVCVPWCCCCCCRCDGSGLMWHAWARLFVHPPPCTMCRGACTLGLNARVKQDRGGARAKCVRSTSHGLALRVANAYERRCDWTCASTLMWLYGTWGGPRSLALHIAAVWEQHWLLAILALATRQAYPARSLVRRRVPDDRQQPAHCGRSGACDSGGEYGAPSCSSSTCLHGAYRPNQERSYPCIWVGVSADHGGGPVWRVVRVFTSHIQTLTLTTLPACRPRSNPRSLCSTTSRLP